MRRAVRLVVLGALVSLMTGCVAVETHPADTGDNCATERAALRGSRDYYEQAVARGETVGGAVGGAIGETLGTVAGWLTGTAQTERPRAMGVAAGAAVGGFTSYYLAKLETATDAASLGGSVLQDLLVENQAIDRASVSFARLRECRFAAARQVKEELACGQIDQAQASSRLDGIGKRFAQDLAIAEEVGAKMSTRTSEFQFASAELLKQDPAAQAHVETPRSASAKKPHAAATRPPVARPGAPPAAAVAEAAETNQVKQKAFAADVAAARIEAQSRFAIEGTISVIEPAAGTCARA